MKPLDDDELDARLREELTHDPGEEYFASFAERVSARIAAEASAAAPARQGVAARLAAWFTPRRMAWAGGTLALVVVAGIAWQGAQRQATGPLATSPDVKALRSGPSPEGAPDSERPAEPPQAAMKDEPMASNEARDAGPAAPSAAGTRQEASSSRMYEVRTLPNGEQVPVRPFAATPPASLAPIPGESEQARAKRALIAQPLREQQASQPRAQAEAAPASPTSDHRGGVQRSIDEDAGAMAGMVIAQRSDTSDALCGTVLGPSGRPIEGAQVTLASSGTGAVTDAHGAFCLPHPSASGTLSVLAVGFEELRMAVGPSTVGSFAVRLKAVDPLAVRRPESAQALQSSGTAISLDALGKVKADAYARESAPARAALAHAREADAAAEKSRTTAGWTAAAERWSLVASLVRGEAAVPDARYHEARARFSAWELGPDDRRLRHARVAVDAYLAAAPPGPLRDLALGWRERLGR